LARYNADGNLDTTFDADGVVIIYGETSQDMINSVAIQTDGKIITAGYSDARGDDDIVIIRYNTNGTPDNTFGLSGIVFTGDRSSQEEARSVIIQSDEKIVAVGYSLNGSTTDFVLARYKTNGTPDSTFGINGIVKTLDLGHKGFYSTVIQSSDTGSGKIIVGGCTNFYGTYDFTLARYNPDGTLDNSFGKDGTTITVISSSSDIANSIILQSADNGENKIIVGGISSQSGVSDFALARYNFNGTIDSTFGEDGIVTTTVGRSQNKAFSTVIQNDGKIIVAGTTINETNFDAALIRYTSDGNLDNTFGANGSVIVGGSRDECIYSAAIQWAGSGGEKIIVGGFSSESGTKDFVLARFNLDGTLDTTFGNGGTAVTPIGSAHDEINSITVQENGKIIAAGYTDNGSDKDFAIARYMPDGELDSTFGGAGYVTTSIGTKDERANSVVIESAGMGDAKIIAVGYVALSDHDFALVRYKPNGELDDSFGDDGIVTTKIGAMSDEANSVAIQSDGKIIAAGFTTSEADGKKYFALVRYNTDGNLDSSFRNNGIITTKPGVSSNGVIQSVSIQSNGKIIVAGYCIQLGVTYDFALARYNPDGELDNTFGSYGFVTTSIGSAYATSHAYSSVIQSDGKIVTAGYTQNPYRNYCSFALARYKGDPVTDVDEKKMNIPLSSFFLKQNYPNPFNPGTTLSFAIAHRSFVSLKVYDILGREVATLVNEEKQPGTYEVQFVSLKVYDILGREVATLVNEEKQPGTYEVQFDTRQTTNNRQLSSGIYFYQLQAGEFTETKKMILLR
ncbi:MAG: T9SS type A sorting domain-containing protein, partial [Ignavibacteriaceae bacterium]